LTEKEGIIKNRQ